LPHADGRPELRATTGSDSANLSWDSEREFIEALKGQSIGAGSPS
jgi:hypothetical protein